MHYVLPDAIGQSLFKNNNGYLYFLAFKNIVCIFYIGTIIF